MASGAPGVTCLVTIHGIGFQQPPAPDGSTAGYADDLHQRLSRHLDAALLSDDPQRRRDQRGERGTIYVQSSWPPGTNLFEAGLARLGTWASRDSREIDGTDAPLVADGARIAHVALVYSSLEAAAKAGLALSHYAMMTGLAGMIVRDGTAMLEGHTAVATATPN
jgi:hypothetical protein